METVAVLIILACALAFLVGLALLSFRRKRRLGARMTLGGLVLGVLAVFLFNYALERRAVAEGFEKASDRFVANEAGITDPKAFYADAEGIRERVKQKRLAEKAAREKAAHAERDAAEAAERAQRRKAVEALTELATAAPLNQQPPPNPEFGRGYYRYKNDLLTAAGYPFVRLREDLPVCSHPYVVKDAADAVKAKDHTWLASIRACTLLPKGTAVEWSKESVGGLAVVELRLKTPDGGRKTAYAPDFSDAGIPFWAGFYDVAKMRTEASASGR